ncbi:unnamed protein product, partial [Prorocentrum cordatum]
VIGMQLFGFGVRLIFESACVRPPKEHDILVNPDSKMGKSYLRMEGTEAAVKAARREVLGMTFRLSVPIGFDNVAKFIGSGGAVIKEFEAKWCIRAKKVNDGGEFELRGRQSDVEEAAKELRDRFPPAAPAPPASRRERSRSRGRGAAETPAAPAGDGAADGRWLEAREDRWRSWEDRREDRWEDQSWEGRQGAAWASRAARSCLCPPVQTLCLAVRATARGMPAEDRPAAAPPSISEALRAAVAPGGGASEAQAVRAAVEAARADPPGAERFWAASVLLLELPGGPAAGGHGPAAQAEEVLRGCPDCAALWGFGRLHGLFAPAPPASLVAELARSSGLAPVAAAYALAAGQGGSLGRLAWGRLRAGEAAPIQDIGGLLDPEMPWAWPRPQEEAADGGGLSEALEMATSVASAAVAHAHTSVPQPVELEHLRRSREEDRVNYALAEQLAASGDVGGVAAKAEMLFYGKESVVPGGGALPATSPSAVGFRVVGAALVAVAIALPCVTRCVVSRCCGWRRRRSQRASDAPESTPESSGKCSGSFTALAQVTLCIAAGLLVYSSGPLLAPPGALLRDEALSLQLFSEAADGGHWGAAYALLLAAADDGGNKSEAEPWLEQVVEQGDAPARAFAAHFQSRWGVGSERDPQRAGELLREAAELGEPNAALLLAEAHAHAGGNESEVWLEGSPNLSVALHYYRQAAAAGLSTCRYNIGAILLRQAGDGPGPVPAHVLREARAEFAAVATDLDPTVRLLFALGVRSWELGDSAAALRTFMLLSEVGSDKAHRNAARLWEQRAAGGRTAPWWPPVASLLAGSGLWSGALEPRQREAGEQPPGGLPRAPECGAGQGLGAETFRLAHRGMYCCAGGDCHAAQWLLNEGDVDPVDCMRWCRDEPACSYATVYDTGFCQLSEECEVTAEAGDPTAATYALTRGPPDTCGAPVTQLRRACPQLPPLRGAGRPSATSPTTTCGACAVAYH